MQKTLTMLALLGLLTLGATEALAGTQSRKGPRDGSGDGCLQSARPALAQTVAAQGSGNGGGDRQRKRDGSCSGSGGGERQRKRDGSCKP